MEMVGAIKIKDGLFIGDDYSATVTIFNLLLIIFRIWNSLIIIKLQEL